MKRRPTSLLVVLIGFVLSLPLVSPAQAPPCSLGTPFRDCAACGTAKSIKVQRDNVLKNRDQAADPVKILQVRDIRDPDRNNSFYPDMGVEITGYVARVLAGPQRETCNCGRTDLRDVVISLVSDFTERIDSKNHVILEISPRWLQKLNLDDSNYQQMLQKLRRELEGKIVTFRGWMFYDSAHLDESESTNPGNALNWRATPWELHPVTSYKVVSR